MIIFCYVNGAGIKSIDDIPAKRVNKDVDQLEKVQIKSNGMYGVSSPLNFGDQFTF